MAVQLAGGVWWVSQQASTVAGLEETVSQLGSRMAIEDNINLKRDVEANSTELNHAFEEVDDLLDEIAGMTTAIGEINKIKQRIAVMENDLKYIGRDHNGMMNREGGAK